VGRFDRFTNPPERRFTVDERPDEAALSYGIAALFCRGNVKNAMSHRKLHGPHYIATRLAEETFAVISLGS